MSDLIERQAAIETVEFYVTKYDPYPRVVEALEELPSVQPQKGKWIDYSDEGYVECPFCHSATNCDGNKDELHYCFSCGADMREGDAE